MRRTADAYRDPVTGELLINCLAEVTAKAFFLIGDDGFEIPAALYGVARAVAARDVPRRSR